MSTSDINLTKKYDQRTAVRYLLISLFCFIFGLVYELFSNDVYSAFMLGAFGFPLVLGTLPFLVFAKTAISPTLHARYLYHSGIASLTVGSVIEGVLEIYGTTNRLTAYYWYLGIALASAGIVAFIADLIIKTTKKPQ